MQTFRVTVKIEKISKSDSCEYESDSCHKTFGDSYSKGSIIW